ncbi:MAG: NAD-dependent epimerase/dehydratase family protein [Bacteroidota bacterium]
MIIGSGLIAESFKKNKMFIDTLNENCLLFASGVSNSSETEKSKFKREYDFLVNSLENNNHEKVIYFSTLSIYDPTISSSNYIEHKLLIEEYLFSLSRKILVLRAPNIVGYGGNKKTLMNHFFSSVLNEKEIVLWRNAKRNLLAIDHLVEMTIELLQSQYVGRINIGFPFSYSPHEIIHEIEYFLNKRAKVKTLNKGQDYLKRLELDKNIKYYSNFPLYGKDNYINFLLKKYYSEYL